MIVMDQKLFQQHPQGSKPVLVEFWAPWCVYCRRIIPALNKISEQYRDKLILGKVNIDEEEALANAEQIEVIPTLVIYKEGKALGSIVAPESKARIEQFIQETLGI